jgi:hypothetical protein
VQNIHAITHVFVSHAGVCVFELLSGKRPTEDLLDLFDERASIDSVAEALDSRVGDWVLEDVLVLVNMAMQFQETRTSKRPTVAHMLPQLEELLIRPCYL